jgi:hypothetical protein
MTTKREIIEQAYSELGLAEYNFDISPEEMSTARKRLDRMMAQWEAKIALGYLAPSAPNDSEVNDESGLPDGVINAAATNLAMLLAPGLGKQVSPATALAAKSGYNSVLAQFAQIPRMQYPNNLPVGAGNKPFPGRTGYFNPSPELTVSINGQTLDDSEGDVITLNSTS